MVTEEMSIFKSYLRRLLRDLKDARENVNEEDEKNKKAIEILDNLIKDTQKGIED